MSLLNEPIKEVLELKNYIGGKWVKSTSGKTLDVKNPATQKTIAKVPMSSPDEVNAAVAAAKEAFPEWRRTPPLVRARYLFKLRELLEEHFEELSCVQTMEHGKTIDESRGETRRGVEMIEVASAVQNADRLPMKTELRRRPELGELIERAGSSRQSDEGIRQLQHARLAF